MIQDGQEVIFKSGGDPDRIQKVQLAVGRDRFRYPRVNPTLNTSAKQLQVVTSGDEARYPVICPFPANIGTPAAWFQHGKGITVTGSGVSQWDDQSGNARHLKQGTDANRPAKQADGSILFNGTSHYLKCDAFTLNQPETVYILFKQVSWTNTEGIFDGNSAVGGLLYQNGLPPRININAGTSDLASTALAVGTYGAVACVFKAASFVLQVNNTTTLSGGAVGANNMGGFTLGCWGNATLFGNIQVLEAIIFPVAHDASQRASVIRYLMGLGGVA